MQNNVFFLSQSKKFKNAFYYTIHLIFSSFSCKIVFVVFCYCYACYFHVGINATKTCLKDINSDRQKLNSLSEEKGISHDYLIFQMRNKVIKVLKSIRY